MFGTNITVEISISTHTLTWSVTAKMIRCELQGKISTHTLTWSVTYSIAKCYNCLKYFNSHAHVERDVDTLFLYRWEQGFQLTRSRGAWPFSTTFSVFFISFQLTRSRGAWLVVSKCDHDLSYISTHTLTWSVTYKFLPILTSFYISTHTLTWSVTL